jgi:hypothetical protein
MVTGISITLAYSKVVSRLSKVRLHLAESCILDYYQSTDGLLPTASIAIELCSEPKRRPTTSYEDGATDSLPTKVQED